MKGLWLDARFEPRAGYTVSDWEKQTGKVITGSAVWRTPQLAVRDADTPTPGPTQVVIQVRACGVCGSDVHFYETDADGYILYPGLTRFPTILGHEFAGRIVAIGKEVRDLTVGDLVTAEEMIWCGECVPCRNGYFNHCQRLEEIGFTIPGAFAEYIVVGAKYCWKIDAIAERLGSEERAFEAAALVEPTSVSYTGLFIRAGGFKPGAYIAVYGAGPIGLAAIGLARTAGAAKIVAFEVSPERRALAERMGADKAYDPRVVRASEVILDMTHGEGADMHIEAAGAMTRTVPEMERSLAINGKIVIIGRAAERVPMYLENLQVRRSQVFGTQGHSGDAVFPSVIRLMASGRLDLTPIITTRYPLAQAVQAIEQTTHRQDGKVMVKME